MIAVPWVSDRCRRLRWAAHLKTLRPSHTDKIEMPQVTLTLNVEKFIGLTPWVNAAVQRPPTNGWWKTRRVSSPDLIQPQRRWYDGSAFSCPVTRADGDAVAEEQALLDSTVPLSDIEWCGLQGPHPSGYEYQLIYL